jgi:hypothetical protein
MNPLVKLNRRWSATASRRCALTCKLLLLALGLFIMDSARATVTLPFYDGFNYTAGTRLGAESPVVWDIGNSTGTSSPTYESAAALTYPGANASTGLGVQMTGTAGSNRDRGVNTASVAITGSETLYAAFMINVQSDPTAQRQIAYWDDNGSAGTPSAGLFLNANRTLSVSKGSATPSATNATPLAAATTAFVVLAYKAHGASGDDEVSVWINPTLGGSEPAPSLTTTSGSDKTALQGFFLSQKTGYTGTIYIDEVRLGTTWADVTPGTSGCDSAAVTSNPNNASVQAGQTATFTVEATGTSRTYQWEYSPDSGANWYPVSGGTGATTASYTTAATTTGENNYQYHCVVSVACDSSTATSSAATLTVTCNGAGILSDPSSTAVTAGQTAGFSVTATGSSPTYQWEYSPDSGANWYPVSGGTGATTASYTTAATDVSQNGWLYHCVVSVACDASTATSAAATLSVSCTTAQVTADPVNKVVPEGSTANFTVTATGSSPTYQWEYSPDNGANWYPVFAGTGGTTASYTTAATTSGDSGYQFHCVVSVACDVSTVTSAAATLTVAAAGSTSFRSAASGNWSDTATWELSPDNGANWFAAGVAPTDVNCTNILISAGTTVTIANADVTADDLVVAAGGNLTIASNRKITVADGAAGTDLVVYGTVENTSSSGSALTLAANATVVVGSGGVLIHNGTSNGWVSPGAGSSITFAGGGKFQLVKAGGRIPLAVWNTGANCEIAYTADGGKPDTGYLSQDFADFTINCPAQTSGWDFAGRLTNVQGDFTVTIGASGGGVECKLFTSSAPVGTTGLNIGGNLIVNAGRLNIASSGGPWAVSLAGDLTVNAGGSIDVSGSASASYTMILNGAGTQNYTINGANTATKLNWTVNSGTTLNLNSDLPLSTAGRTLTVEGTLNANGKTVLADLLAGAGTIQNQGGGSGRLVLGTGGGVNTLGTAPSLVDGTSGTLGLGKSGSGLLTITDPQTFGGGLVVSNGTVLVNNASGSGTGGGAVSVVGGTLGGTGTIAGSVTVESAGNLAPGASIDDLTISGVLTLNGNFTSEVNTGSTPNTDQVLGTSAVNYGGTLTINNQGGLLTTSDTFQIFPAGTRTGSFTIVPANPDNDAGLAWDTSTLTTDGTLRIVTGVVSSPNLGMSQSGNALTFSWSEAGFKLQSLTNDLSSGIWGDYPGGGSSPVNVTVDPAGPNMFFRLSQ